MKTHCVNGHPKTPENTGANYSCLPCVRARTKVQRIEHPEVKRKCQHQSWEPLKREVLTHYGPRGVLGCCWEDCMVVDLDMLSLDHIHDDGYKHHKEGSTVRLSGRALYYWARLNGYPTDLQTLCWNHQWKKRLEKIRETRKCL